MMRSAGNFAPLLLLLFLRGSSSNPPPSSAAPGPGKAPSPGGLEVPRKLTGGQPLNQWFADRLALALEVLGPNVPPPVLHDVALSVVSQWAHETGRGKSEFNFNMGGWRARRTDPYFVARDVQTGKELFRWTAYGDLPNAVHDQLRRLHGTFPTAWALLVKEPNTSRWIEELGRRGYYVPPKGTTQAQHIQNYARAWAMNRAELGRLAA
ncbi:MAG TPA: hypothetical protein VGJ91_17800 [Polyangiaceae bacterium]|jgi:hypothetical protein